MRLLFFAGCFILLSNLTYSQKTITGRVTDGKSPLSNVQISNLASGSKTTSDSEGQYQIMAEPREELQLCARIKLDFFLYAMLQIWL